MKGRIWLLFPKAIEKWQDKKYWDIKKNNPKLFELLQYSKNIIEEFLEHIPNTYGIQNNTIPYLKKTIRESFIKDGTMKAIKGISDSLINSITTDQELQKETGAIDADGRPIKKLRGTMFPKIQIDKSQNIQRILTEYIGMGILLKHKLKIEPTLLLGQKIINELKELQKGPNGSKTDWKGNILQFNNGLQNTKNRVKYLIEAGLYGERKKTELTREIKSGLWKGKTIAGSKVLDQLNQYTVAKGLALAPASGTVNFIWANITNRIEAASSEFFSDDELSKAEISFATGILNKKARTKRSMLMSKLQVLGEQNQAAYGEKSLYDKLYFFHKWGEYAALGNMMEAVLRHDKLWDKVRIEGDNLSIEGLSNEDMFKLSAKIKKLTWDLHGNYDQNALIMGKSKILGRMAFTFRSWLPGAYLNRFGKERFDIDLNTTRKGRYITWNPLTGGDIGRWKGVKDLIKLSIIGKVLGLKVELSPIDLANIKRNLRELYYAAAIYALITFLKGVADDDPDNEEWWTYFINISLRTQNDLLFFASPSAFNQIIRDPIPVYKTIRDWQKFVFDTGSFITGDKPLKTGYWKGHYKVERSAMRAFPITTQYATLKSMTHNIIGDSMGNTYNK